MTLNPASLRVETIAAPDGAEVIVGQGFFSPLTIEELYREIAVGARGCQFGIAMVEGSSGIVRRTGNNSELQSTAASNALTIGAGHVFIVVLQGAYPIQVVTGIKQLASVVTVFCATGNPLSLIIVDTIDGAAVVGVVDGIRAASVEDASEVSRRRALVRQFGYLEHDPG